MNKNRYVQYYNFFAYVELLDREKNGYSINMYDYSYDIYSKNVRDTMEWTGKKVVYSNINMGIYSEMFCLVWEREIEKYFENRTFLYYINNVSVDVDNNSFVYFDKQQIILRTYIKSNYYEYKYALSEIIRKIEDGNKDINNMLSQYYMNNEKFIMNRISDELNRRFELIGDYNWNYEQIKKYKYRNAINQIIEKSDFVIDN